MLDATGRCGHPESHFHDPSLAAWLEEYDLRRESFAGRRDALRAVFAAAIARGRGATGLTGIRMQRQSFPFFLAQLGVLHPEPAGDAARIATIFGETRYIHLRRADKLAQAVSFLKARQSGLWHRAPDGTEIERLSPPAPPRYDRAEIAALIERFTQDDADWESWFAAQGIAPLRIGYDALSQDPRACLGRVLEYLGQEAALARRVEIPVARLADATNRAWITRYTSGG